ncbi:hypothetical protein Tco_0435264, partial [Tanacetum coccineum]
VDAHVVQDGGVNIVADEEVEATVADNLKKLREDHDTSGDVSASTDGKSLAMIQELLERKREGGNNIDSISGPNLRTQRPTERFVIYSDSFHHSSTNVADVEATSIVRSPFPPPLVMTAAVATTVVFVVTSSLVLGVGTEPIHASIFADSVSVGMVGPDIARPSQPARTELSVDTFYVSLDMDSETLKQIYV